MRRGWLALVLGSSLVTGCSTDASLTPCLAPDRLVDGICRSPGVQDDGCLAGELAAPDGSCRPAGALPELCPPGFVFDAAGPSCEPILPLAPCPPGQLAVPGDGRCRPVADCPTEKWGGIPQDEPIEHVDVGFSGTSEGSAAAPWPSIGEALAVAADGAIIAIAAGSYEEDLSLTQPVRLWGECPDRVTIVGSGTPLATIDIRAAGVEIHRLAVSGGSIGILASSARAVVLAELWIHDTGGRGIDVEDTLGPASVTVRGTLIERARGIGIFLQGVSATVADSVVRGTEVDALGAYGPGRGLALQNGAISGVRGDGTFHNLVIEHNRDMGVFVSGARATGIGLVVRDTQTEPSSANDSGIGIQARTDPATGVPAELELSGSLIERNHAAGITISGSATLDGITVRDTQPSGQGVLGGRGISVQLGASGSTDVTLRHSLFVGNHDIGILVAGSGAIIEGVRVAGTLPQPAFPGFGRGIGIQPHPNGGSSNATVVGSALEQNQDLGLFVQGSHAEVVGLLVQGTLPRETDQLYGDGLVAFPTETAAARLDVSASAVVNNARAGVAMFGATGSLRDSHVACNAVDLVIEPHLATTPALDDGGGNDCSCAAEGVPPCKALSAGLAAPEPQP